MTKSHPEETLGANPGDAALNPADPVAMGLPAVPNLASENTGSFRALTHKPFRLLFVAFIINQTGFWISHLSLQKQMTELSNNDTRLIGLLFFFLFLPAFLFAPVAGVAADHFDRKVIVISCYSLIASCCGVLSLLTVFEAMTPHRMLAVAFCMGLSFAFSGPASFAIAANTVPAEDLPSAVALQSAANNLTRVLGPFIATPLVATGRFDISFASYLVAALIAAFLTLLMKIERFVPRDDGSGIFSRMHDGFVHARERHPVLPALSLVAMLSFFGVSHTVLFTAYATDVLQDGRYFTWLVCATGVGAVAGALRSGRSSNPDVSTAAGQLIIYGAALCVFANTDALWVALSAQVVVGYCYFAVMTSLQTLIQQVVDEAKRGRVMSLFQVCWAGLVPFGSLAMGYIAQPIGTSATLFISALVCLGYGTAMLFVSRRWLPSTLAATSSH